MLENGHEESKIGTMKGAPEYNSSTSTGLNQLTYKLVRVEGDGTFVPALEDEVIEVEHLLAEAQNEKAFDDHTMHLNSVTEKCLTIEAFPCSNDYYKLSTDFGISNSDAARDGEHESKFEFLDGMLQAVDEEGNLHLMGNLSNSCPDYLLDTAFSEKRSLFDYAPHDGPCLGNFGSECQPETVVMSSSAVEILDFSNAIIPLPDIRSDQDSALFLDNMSISELHEAFRSTFGRDTSVNDKQWLKCHILFGLQNLIEPGNTSCLLTLLEQDTSSLLESGLTLNEVEDHMILIPANDSSERVYGSFTNISDNKTVVGKVVAKERRTGKDVPTASYSEAGRRILNSGNAESALTTRKRMRKPTRRYIEESSDVKSTCCNESPEVPVTSSRDKIVRARNNNLHHWKGSGALPPVHAEESPAGSDTQILCTLRVRRGRPRKNFTFGENDSKGYKVHRLHAVTPRRKCGSGLSGSESNNCASTSRNDKGGFRRKHNRLWTLPEVMKLIEGVSHYGVGRWTEIKRLLFPSSAYRTSVDLKDKWRNLLRTTGAQLRGKKEVEPRKHASLLMPQSVVRHVRELAIIFPYPRERKSRVPSLAAA